MSYVPERGDIVWLTLNPQVGHEQAGRRPALVLSPASYNELTGLAVFCPITSKVKGYPFEVRISDGLAAKGVVLADQVKSLDWQMRTAAYLCSVPTPVVQEVWKRLARLLE